MQKVSPSPAPRLQAGESREWVRQRVNGRAERRGCISTSGSLEPLLLLLQGDTSSDLRLEPPPGTRGPRRGFIGLHRALEAPPARGAGGWDRGHRIGTVLRSGVAGSGAEQAERGARRSGGGSGHSGECGPAVSPDIGLF
ncbi:unnamed protein product [Pleuronectes platessa]|uniref:Uncharacterized protein n=1 Tax=Pleuronectes platessa TaxID=8262 RepID=A0A9N7VEK2_PLEPL|nr:unnamed protein product [Pleuronectes platessa]